MPSLNNVGKTPAETSDIETKSVAEVVLDGGVSRSYVSERASELASAKATKIDVDLRDEQYAEPAYYQTRDALLLPNTAKGVANGVAVLNSSGKLKPENVPNLGAGILRGPYGLNAAYAGSTNNTPLKIAEWNLGVTALSFKVQAFLSAMVTSTGRPCIELKISNAGQTAYADQTQIGLGKGRSFYYDLQTLSMVSSSPTLGDMQDGIQTTYPPSMNVLLTAWLYDIEGGTSSIASGMIVSSGSYLVRTSL